MTAVPVGTLRRSSTGVPDRGDIVLGWLARVVVGLAVLGVVAFDGLSIGSSRLAVQDTGVTAARAAAGAWHEHHDAQGAYAAAAAAARADHPGNVVPPASFRLVGDGGVTLAVRREAATVAVHRLPWTAGWAQVEATVSRAAGI